MALKPLKEIEEVVNSKVMGPVLRLSLEDLWKHYKTLEADLAKERQHHAVARKEFEKEIQAVRKKFNQNLTDN